MTMKKSIAGLRERRNDFGVSIVVITAWKQQDNERERILQGREGGKSRRE